MKNLIIGLLFGAGGILLTATNINQSDMPQDAPEIATVHVVEKATRVIIRTTIEGQESTAKNVESGYVPEEDMVNFKPVIDELSRLRAMGYELQSSSVSSVSYGKRTIMRPYHSFLLVKK